MSRKPNTILLCHDRINPSKLNNEGQTLLQYVAKHNSRLLPFLIENVPQINIQDEIQNHSEGSFCYNVAAYTGDFAYRIKALPISDKDKKNICTTIFKWHMNAYLERVHDYHDHIKNNLEKFCNLCKLYEINLFERDQDTRKNALEIMIEHEYMYRFLSNACSHHGDEYQCREYEFCQKEGYPFISVIKERLALNDCIINGAIMFNKGLLECDRCKGGCFLFARANKYKKIVKALNQFIPWSEVKLPVDRYDYEKCWLLKVAPIAVHVPNEIIDMICCTYHVLMQQEKKNYRIDHTFDWKYYTCEPSHIQLLMN